MKKLLVLLPIGLFLFLTIFIFRQYVFLGKVPFAGNLLISFYEPWKSYAWDGYGANGPANKPIGFDSLRIFYPLRSLTIDSLKHFQLPLWNPYDFAGNTQLATYQSAIFFPLTPLFLLLPQIDAWSLVVFLEPFLTACFTYFFLRSLLFSKKSSVIGALSFGFSAGILVLSEESFMSVYSLMALPLLFWGLYAYFKKGSIRWFALIVGSIVWSIFSGWFQSTLYVLLAGFFWMIFLSFQTKSFKKLLAALWAFLIALLLASPHVFPNVQSYLYSARGTTDAKFLFDTYLLQPWHLITYFAPDFFGNPGTYNYFDNGFYYEKVVSIGVVGIMLALIALFRLRKSGEEWFFTIASIVTISLGLSLPTSWFVLYYLHIPLISTILPSRIFLLTAFFLSILATYGLESLFKKPSKIAIGITTLVTILIFLTTWYFLHHEKIIHPGGRFALVSYRNFLLPTLLTLCTIFGIFLLLIKKSVVKLVGYTLLLLIALVSIGYFANKYLYFSEKTFTFPTAPVVKELQKVSGNNRIWSFGDGYMERNFATLYQLQSPEGYDSFYIRTFGEFITASKNGGNFTTDIPRADAQLTTVSHLSEIAHNPSLQKALNLLGVKYIFAKVSTEDEKYLTKDSGQHFTKIWTDGKFVIYQNNQASPRVFLSSFYAVQANPTRRLATIFSPATNLSKEIIVDKNPGFTSSEKEVLGNAQITTYAHEKVVVATKENQDTLLFLSDNNYPGWQAYVDGKPTEILTADHTFRAVALPSGSHTVVFAYTPQTVTDGFILGGIGLLLFMVTGFTIRQRVKKI